jgi:hypothetical protein
VRDRARVSRARVLSDVETETVLGDEEGVDRPVPSVALVPHAAAVQQFHQRLEFARAVLTGAERLSSDARKVEDRHDTFGDVHLRQRAIDDADRAARSDVDVVEKPGLQFLHRGRRNARAMQKIPAVAHGRVALDLRKNLIRLNARREPAIHPPR